MHSWQDGVGPRDQRPRRVNIHCGEVVESNQFGTQEFIRFCRMVGAEPYIVGNVGSGSVRELHEWVEYCNFPGASTLAQQRVADGSIDPLNVTYWGVGNENWGCGGSFSPEDYCTEFHRFATFVRGFGKQLYVIACGSPGNDLEWTTRFFRKLRKDYWDFKNLHGYAAHYYCGTAGTATEYTMDQWYELIARGLYMEDLVVQQRAAMDAYDPARKIGLIIDEWGTWHPVEPGTNPAFLFQQNSLRDALVTATSLDIFNRHADKVLMANIAQTIKTLCTHFNASSGNNLTRKSQSTTDWLFLCYAQGCGDLTDQSSIAMIARCPRHAARAVVQTRKLPHTKRDLRRTHCPYGRAGPTLRGHSLPH